MKKIIVIGTGGHAKSCIDVIEQENKYKIIGLIEKNKTNNKNFLGYPILGTDKVLEKFKMKCNNLFLGIGQIKDSSIRSKKFKKLTSMGFNFPVIISPKSYVSSKSEIGNGTIIMHKAIVNIDSKIGKNCIINSRSLIEHEVTVGKNCHISTGSVLNGKVQIGNDIFVGSGTIVKEGVRIGSRCVIGMGTIIKRTIKDKKILKK